MKPSLFFIADRKEVEDRITKLIDRVDDAVRELYDAGCPIEGTHYAIEVINRRHMNRRINEYGLHAYGRMEDLQ